MGNCISYKKIGAYRYGTVVEVLAEKNGWGRTNIAVSYTHLDVYKRQI